MLFIRSLLFNIFFFVSTAFQLVFWLPVYFFMKPVDCWKVVKSWAWLNLVVQHYLVGASFEFRGTQNIPKDEPFIVAAKHQSSWETYTLVLFLDHPSYILKRELMFVPIFGWFAAKAKVVAVDRGRGAKALQSMATNAKVQYHSGRQIIIYPEGTRTASYAPPKYKYGLTHLYDELQAKIVPVALNSGLFWSRESFYRYPGHFIIEFLPAIEPGLDRDAFSKTLQDVIETATNRLHAETDPEPAA